MPPDFGFSLDRAEAISPDGRFIAARFQRDPTTALRVSAVLEIDSAGTGFRYGFGARIPVNALRDEALLWHSRAPFQTLISLKSPSDTSGVSVLNAGTSIDNSGQILAHGQYQAGNGDVSVLMTPE